MKNNKSPIIHSFPSLEHFRSHIDEYKLGYHHQPYTARKKKAQLYRWIFLLFGLLFLILGAILYIKSFTWSCSFLIGDCTTIKGALCTACGGLAATSLLFAYTLKTEKEVANHYIRQAQHQLSQHYLRNQLKHGVPRFLAFGERYKKAASYHQHYKDAIHELKEIQDETWHLLERISDTRELNRKNREQLFNQAILELKEKLQQVLFSFEKVPLLA